LDAITTATKMKIDPDKKYRTVKDKLTVELVCSDLANKYPYVGVIHGLPKPIYTAWDDNGISASWNTSEYNLEEVARQDVIQRLL
jgi:hypothetical protein